MESHAHGGLYGPWPRPSTLCHSEERLGLSMILGTFNDPPWLKGDVVRHMLDMLRTEMQADPSGLGGLWR